MMEDNQEVPNAALREHVTGFSFVLTMPKSAVLTLDAIAHGDTDRNRGRSRVDRFVSGAHACVARGLLFHAGPKGFDGKGGLGSTNYYKLTRAGWLMHDLLVEAGIVETVTDRKLRRLVA